MFVREGSQNMPDYSSWVRGLGGQYKISEKTLWIKSLVDLECFESGMLKTRTSQVAHLLVWT